MTSFPRLLAATVVLGTVLPPALSSADEVNATEGLRTIPIQLRISRRPSDYANGYGTNAANSYAVTPITPYGGYVVNQYGYGNYVSGPLGYGGYPAGSAEAQIWRQREHWKCQYAPESC